MFRLLPRGFANRDLRQHLQPLLGDDAAPCTPGRMTYDLRRLRLHGLITRLPNSHRYEVTDHGFRTALFLTRAYIRLLRPGVAIASDQAPPTSTQLQGRYRARRSGDHPHLDTARDCCMTRDAKLDPTVTINFVQGL